MTQPLDRARLTRLLHEEEQLFHRNHPKSYELYQRARKSLHGGVPPRLTLAPATAMTSSKAATDWHDLVGRMPLTGLPRQLAQHCELDPATVHRLARAANLPEMPEVGWYPSAEVNAFATGPTRSRALVAVSAGLLERIGAENMNIALTGRNLFTWTDYTGYDPEIGKAGGDTGSAALAGAGKDLADAGAVFLFDQPVEFHEGKTQPLREPSSQGRFSGAISSNNSKGFTFLDV